jgi:hypothetical protein
VFSLAATQFRVVPDFIQSHFTEAPRLDNSKIVLNRTNLLSQSRKGGRARHDPDLAARWRALKRLAIQGHDHAREQAFFKGELEARRWSEDKPWHGVFWLGLVYGLFSDFGRSISRPFFWWLASVAGFACFYLSQHPGIASGSIGLFSAVKGELGIGAESLPLECVSGAGSPVASAALLSLQKGLLVFGLVPLSKIAQLHLCLYGAYSPATLSAEAMSGAVSPSIPNFVTAVSFFQYSVSAILIFLVVLAVRNHFRIR